MASVPCRDCGTQLRDGAVFCDSCGLKVARPGVAEFKQVTVLFADVVRSMHIARSVGAERLSEIMTEMMRRSSGVIRSYGGVVSQFTGDGLMAVFGVPHALEDHAVLGCRAALHLIDEVRAQAVEVLARDGIDLKVRVGLNSGQVIAGVLGSGALGYTTIGEEVGMAQRMESVAPPGGVMLSAATARLVENSVVLGEPETVRVKGQEGPITVRRLLAVDADALRRRTDQQTSLTGRSAELAALVALLDRSSAAHGVVARVVGPAGIGKTRIVRELIEVAARRMMPVPIAYCESHTRAVPFSAAAQILRAMFGITADVPVERARARLRSEMAGADPDDLLLLEDLVGIRASASPLPEITPEARARRLALLITDLLTQRSPTLYVIEDAHWIDEASEALFASAAEAVPRTRSLLLVTHRPEYTGILRRVAAEIVVLQPLPELSAVALATELLGDHPSVRRVADRVVRTAGGNPFFITEMVRDLAERGVVAGPRGNYRSSGNSVDISVPPTLQAAIAARIDRLRPRAKSVLYAAAVIGGRFGSDLLREVVAVDDDETVSSTINELRDAEILDHTSSEAAADIAFRHPLIRAVAYESQLKAVRNEMHRRVASAIERANSHQPDHHATLIAEHLQAAGELRTAFDWHMRAGRWLRSRDRSAAWEAWQRARAAAAALPSSDPQRSACLTTVLTILCSESHRAGGCIEDAGFDELRQLCEASGDRRALGLGMAGMVMALAGQHRHQDALALVPELMALVDTAEDTDITAELLLAVTYARSEVGHLDEALRLVQRAIDSADTDRTKRGVLFGSSLVSAIRMRGLYRLCAGVQGWRADGDTAIAMSAGLDPTSRVSSVLYKYILSVPVGARRVDEVAMRETAEALQLAEQAGDELTLTTARVARGLVLVYGDVPGDEAVELLTKARESTDRRRFTMNAMTLARPALARRMAQRGDVPGAIELVRSCIRDMSAAGEVLSLGVATTVLVEALLARSAEGDWEEAATAIEYLAATPADRGFALHKVPQFRLRALLARCRGDIATAGNHLAQARAHAAAAGYDLPEGATGILSAQRR
ncbi:adenylate/guanylate cyclase domain-containing protein [Mycobacterium sp. SMC-4]|uniref:adenylate/guanylate cyclase domain-containing protein n=1 Tax=Mycobacterium sp. SMC-4 TaxID=2857059 RepID=UPI003D037704